MQNKTLIYHCKKCGFTLRRDVSYELVVYDETLRDMAYVLGHYPITIVATQHISCPNCITGYSSGGIKTWHKQISANAVETHLNPDHECNDECKSATTHKCSCACGGTNHGINYMEQL